MVVHTYEQVTKLRQTIIENAGISLAKIKEYTNTMGACQFFASMKFEKLGTDPITGQSLNLIEQINQMYSDLVVLSAAQYLIDRYPDKAFELQLGVTAGYDVQSTDGQVVAECFAVTSVYSNDKLNKDCKKLMSVQAEHKFVFFYSHEDNDSMLQNRYKKYPEIQFQRIFCF